MKDDVLEQIVDDYLQMQGYFTTHNVRFNPPRDQHYVSQTDSVPSDIDVVGLQPPAHRDGPSHGRLVQVVADRLCRQSHPRKAALRGEEHQACEGASVPGALDAEVGAGFREKIQAITGEHEFTYCLAVTRLQGDAAAWSGDPTIRECLGGNPFRFLTLEDMWGVVLRTVTTTPGASEMGRLA